MLKENIINCTCTVWHYSLVILKGVLKPSLWWKDELFQITILILNWIAVCCTLEPSRLPLTTYHLPPGSTLGLDIVVYRRSSPSLCSISESLSWKISKVSNYISCAWQKVSYKSQWREGCCYLNILISHSARDMFIYFLPRLIKLLRLD